MPTYLATTTEPSPDGHGTALAHVSTCKTCLAFIRQTQDSGTLLVVWCTIALFALTVVLALKSR